MHSSLDLTLVFLGQTDSARVPVGGELAAGDESAEARVFAPTEIPWNDLAFDSTKDALKDYISVYLKQKIA